LKKVLTRLSSLISGDCSDDTIKPFRSVFSSQFGESNIIDIELAAAPMIDRASLGRCLILLKNLSSAVAAL